MSSLKPYPGRLPSFREFAAQRTEEAWQRAKERDRAKQERVAARSARMRAAEGDRLFRRDYDGTIYRCALCLDELFIAAFHIRELTKTLTKAGRPTDWLPDPTAETERRRQHGLAHVARGEAVLSPEGYFVLPAKTAEFFGFKPEPAARLGSASLTRC